MPIHDWTQVRPGLFHDFHQAWTIEIRKALNRGILPPGYVALAEQVTGGHIPDVVALERFPETQVDGHAGGLAVADAPPQARFIAKSASERYAVRANRIVIHEPQGEVVAVIEIVSPGNKDRQASLRSFVAKMVALLENGIHLLVVDLFPPTSRDPNEIHGEIWREWLDEPFSLPALKPLTAAAYESGAAMTAYVEPLAPDDVLPSMPLFLETGRYVRAPLEDTYMSTWADVPAAVRELVDRKS